MLESVSTELKHSRAFEEQMREFAKIVSTNTDIQQKLNAAVDDGIALEGFRKLYVSLAAEHNIHFTVDQMEIAMQEQKQGKDKVLPSIVQKLVSFL